MFWRLLSAAITAEVAAGISGEESEGALNTPQYQGQDGPHSGGSPNSRRECVRDLGNMEVSWVFCEVLKKIYLKKFLKNVFTCFCSTRRWIQGLKHCRQALCHWATPQPEIFIFLQLLTQLRWRISLCWCSVLQVWPCSWVRMDNEREQERALSIVVLACSFAFFAKNLQSIFWKCCPCAGCWG